MAKDAVRPSFFFDFENDHETTHWMELDRELADIDQLYRVFQWNMLQLRCGVDVAADGSLRKVSCVGDAEDTSIAVNGYTMNAVSSGVDLVETLRAFSRHEAKNDFTAAEDFECFVNRQYDNDFNYAFMAGLRNYSQHGQLTVSCGIDDKGDEYLHFDLYQLLNPVLIKEKKSFRKRIENLIGNRADSWGDSARLSFVGTVLNFNSAIHGTYCKFLAMVTPYVQLRANLAAKKCESNPEKVFHDPDNNLCVPLCDGANMHLDVGAPEGLIAETEKRTKKAKANLGEAENQVGAVKRFFSKRV